MLQLTTKRPAEGASILPRLYPKRRGRRLWVSGEILFININHSVRLEKFVRSRLSSAQSVSDSGLGRRPGTGAKWISNPSASVMYRNGK